MGQGGMESLVEGGLNQEVVEDLEAAVKVDREVVVVKNQEVVDELKLEEKVESEEAQGDQEELAVPVEQFLEAVVT